MDFPWAEVFGGILPAILLVILIICAPAIIGSLIGEILRFFRNLFGKDDDEE